MNKHEPRIGDWVRPINGWMPGPGCYFGKVVGEATYSKLNIPAWLVDTNYGETKPALCPKEALEYWFTPEEAL